MLLIEVALRMIECEYYFIGGKEKKKKNRRNIYINVAIAFPLIKSCCWLYVTFVLVEIIIREEGLVKAI